MEYRFPRPPNPTPICNILNKKTGEFVPNTAFTENSNFVYRRNLETKELTYTGQAMKRWWQRPCYDNDDDDNNDCVIIIRPKVVVRLTWGPFLERAETFWVA